MKAVILAGGRGTRLQEETDVIPKPMVRVGGIPLIEHIMRIYAANGVSEFVVALGYRGEVIKEYFASHYLQRRDLTVEMHRGLVEMHPTKDDEYWNNWRIHLIDTGLETMTGGRIRRLRDWLSDGTFCLTYGDGLGNVDIAAAVKFHRQHRATATLTAVHPPPRWGHLELDGPRVSDFREKPQASDGWINGGFYVLEPSVLDLIEGDRTIFEQGPLPALGRSGGLHAFRHEGFWQGIDTVRELVQVRELWESGERPWLKR